MRVVSMHEAKTKLSQLVSEAEAGEEVVIARNKTPVARLVPIVSKKRVPGGFKGKVSVPEDFFDPLPDEELDAWEQ